MPLTRILKIELKLFSITIHPDVQGEQERR